MSVDPTLTDPDKYKVIFENDRARVLLFSGDMQRDVELRAGIGSWLPAQQHSGENIGDTSTHTIFIELKEAAGKPTAHKALGPDVAGHGQGTASVTGCRKATG